MRFRGLLRGGTVEKLDVWLRDARRSGIYGMQRFARALRHDIEAVRNAVPETWSNGFIVCALPPSWIAGRAADYLYMRSVKQLESRNIIRLPDIVGRGR